MKGRVDVAGVKEEILPGSYLAPDRPECRRDGM